MTLYTVARAEWVKVRTVRSLWGLVVGVALTSSLVSVLVNALFGQAEADNGDFEALNSAFYGVNFGLVVAVCLGVVTVAGEYTDGQVRSSLTAVPRRGLFYAAKLLVLGVLALLAGLFAGFAGFLGSEPLLGRYGVGLGAPGALRACVGCGLYLALLALFAGGLAAVLRSTTAALGVLVPFVLLVSPVLASIPAVADVAGWLPDRAGQQILYSDPEGPLGAWQGMGVLAAWTALALWAGWRSLARRDA